MTVSVPLKYELHTTSNVIVKAELIFAEPAVTVEANAKGAVEAV